MSLRVTKFHAETPHYDLLERKPGLFLVHRMRLFRFTPPINFNGRE